MPKVKKRTATKTVIKIKRRRPGIAVCASCGKQLHGVPRLNATEMKKMAKTKKRPERAYGGYYCSRCTKELFKDMARKIE